MTDIHSSQLAVYFAGVDGSANIQSSQVAVYFATKDASLGIQVSQIVVYSAEREYDLPINLHGWTVPAVWGNPLFIQRRQFI